jgi:hypothetical protein
MWHGGELRSADDVQAWLTALKDERNWLQIRRSSITYGFAHALFRRFGQLDEVLDVSPSTQLGITVNELRAQGAVTNLTGVLLRTAASGLGVDNSATYRLLYHAGMEMKHEDPDMSRSMHNFLSMLDNNNCPPDATRAVANLQRPITLEDTRWLQAVTVLTSEEGRLRGELDPTFALDSALAGTHNLLRFIHEQRPHDESRTNAQKLLDALKAQATPDPYGRLRDKTNQMPRIPYTTYIKLANSLSDSISASEQMQEPLGKLDEISIEGLPQALDRILFVACLGNVSAVITDKPEVKEVVSMARNAIDNVIEMGITRKRGPIPVTIQEAAIALQLYLPQAEASAALRRMIEEDGQPRTRDALNRSIKLGRQQWLDRRLKSPGRGKLS